MNKSQSGSLELCHRKRERIWSKVKLDDGRIWRHHLDHLIKTQIQITPERNEREIDFGADSIETEPSEQVEPQKDSGCTEHF